MPVSYLHGVETLQVDNGVKVITTAATAVIGIIGVNGVSGNSADPTKLGVPVLITPSQTLEEQGLLATWPVYKAIKTIFDLASPLVIWIPYGVDEVGTADLTAADAVDKFLLCRNLLGFGPKILITDDPATCPTASMVTNAGKLRAIAVVDVEGDTVQAMITARAGLSSKRVFAVGPSVKVGGVDTPYSWVMAAMIAQTDDTWGYHYSPSNKVIDTVEATAFALTSSMTDASSDANVLNAAGIATLFSGYGTGFRTWGNRNASFPAAAGIETFVAVVRTADVLEDAIEQVSLQWIDKPINNALIDSIVESVNAFFRTKIGEGVLVDGEASFEAAKNTVTEISNGHLVISYAFVPPPPLERLTFRSFININLLSALITE